MKDIGIVGVPYAGKSTLFTALTRTGSSGGGPTRPSSTFPTSASGPLRDRGLEEGRAAKVRFVDVPGGLTAQGIAEFRQTDALCIVVRAFGPDAKPESELSGVEAELILADLANIESGLEKGRKRARSQPEVKARSTSSNAATICSTTNNRFVKRGGTTRS